MGQAQPFKKIALVVEDDALQRETIVTLLEESEMDVIQCESGEAAALVLDHVGGCVTALLTDVNLAGAMDGVELAQIARERFPRCTSSCSRAIRAPAGYPTAPSSSPSRGIHWSCQGRRMRGIEGAVRRADDISEPRAPCGR